MSVDIAIVRLLYTPNSIEISTVITDGLQITIVPVVFYTFISPLLV